MRLFGRSNSKGRFLKVGLMANGHKAMVFAPVVDYDLDLARQELHLCDVGRLWPLVVGV